MKRSAVEALLDDVVARILADAREQCRELERAGVPAAAAAVSAFAWHAVATIEQAADRQLPEMGRPRRDDAPIYQALVEVSAADPCIEDRPLDLEVSARLGECDLQTVRARREKLRAWEQQLATLLEVPVETVRARRLVAQRLELVRDGGQLQLPNPAAEAPHV